ncbi:MAG: hypothetical protein ACK40G_11095 [Cytophagaceae bacterium]
MNKELYALFLVVIAVVIFSAANFNNKENGQYGYESSATERTAHAEGSRSSHQSSAYVANPEQKSVSKSKSFYKPDLKFNSGNQAHRGGTADGFASGLSYFSAPNPLNQKYIYPENINMGDAVVPYILSPVASTQKVNANYKIAEGENMRKGIVNSENSTEAPFIMALPPPPPPEDIPLDDYVPVFFLICAGFAISIHKKSVQVLKC